MSQSWLIITFHVVTRGLMMMMRKDLNGRLQGSKSLGGGLEVDWKHNRLVAYRMT